MISERGPRASPGSRSWLERYNESHRHPVNRALHTLGIPMIALSFPVALAAALRWPALWVPALALFACGWLLQFIGHWIEGRPPAFFSDWRFLVTGMAWWVAKLRGRRR